MCKGCEDLINYRAQNNLTSEDSVYQAYAKQYAIDNDVYEDIETVAASGKIVTAVGWI